MEGHKRFGFTTGSCAAAAAKAAAFMLLTGRKKVKIRIQTPKGIMYETKIQDISRREGEVSCAVMKDGGEDPDVTTGTLIYARVRIENREEQQGGLQIRIDGGKGVGRVTKPGLDQPVGNAAINCVPREMIRAEVAQVCEMADFHGALFVEIFVPDGEELAKRTFNPRLGIKGGISILGTTGIVEPMSEKALRDTILLELKQRRALGEEIIAITPGNYGMDYMKRTFGYDLDGSVKCSNYIGDTIDMAADCGFRAILLTGHIGKLVKLSGGIMNTHSKEGDCRMELLAAAALQEGAGAEEARAILQCVSTEEALALLYGTDRFARVLGRLMNKIVFYLENRASGRVHVECMMYANGYGELISSGGAKGLLRELMQYAQK